jgi:hypothetical protein
MHKCTVDTKSLNIQGYVYSLHILQSRDAISYSIMNININILPKDGCNCYSKTSTADQQTDNWEYQYYAKSSQQALYNVVP